MRVVAFAPALTVTEEEDGGIAATGFPMTNCFISEAPTEITLSVMIGVCALSGGEYDPIQYLIATGPNGERAAAMEFHWHWDDIPETPVKFRVFAQYLPVQITSTGMYIIGLYDSLDATVANAEFPLPVNLYDPTTQGPGNF
ncbi:MAG: hypothetical protein NT146_10805 [Mycobacterium sp.]|nr:hypothetical protein [Mycobacterium sp.]